MIGKPLGYFDSSVAVKRYLREPESRVASQLLRQYRFLSSRLTPIEIKSVFKRKFAAGDINENSYTAALRKLETDRAKWELVVVSPAILDSTEELVQHHNIRTSDALHIACAIAIETRIRSKLPFITADLRQREAAVQAGLKIIPAE